MKNRNLAVTLITTLLFSGAALAQSTNASVDVQRDANQQQRIEQGLKSGELTTKEAGKLENQEKRVDKMEARDMKNGTINAREQAKINAAQNHESASIYADKHNGATGNPNSKSSERLQADVQRNANQESRIESGLKSGQLNTKQAGSLERGQARVDAKESAAAANGHVSAKEQAHIQASENHQNRRIKHKKHG